MKHFNLGINFLRLPIFPSSFESAYSPSKNSWKVVEKIRIRWAEGSHRYWQNLWENTQKRVFCIIKQTTFGGLDSWDSGPTVIITGFVTLNKKSLVGYSPCRKESDTHSPLWACSFVSYYFPVYNMERPGKDAKHVICSLPFKVL